MKWIRLYTKVPDDPKVQCLPAELFKFWINVLCLTGDAEQGSRVPNAPTLGWRLHLSTAHVEKLLQALNNANLISKCEPTDAGQNSHYEIHDWEEYQKPSDFSKERQRRHRDRHRDGVVTRQSRAAAAAIAAARREESVAPSAQRQVPPSAQRPLTQIIPFAAAACAAAAPTQRAQAEKALLQRADDIRNARNPEGLALTILADFGISAPPRKPEPGQKRFGGDDYDELAAEIRKHRGAAG